MLSLNGSTYKIEVEEAETPVLIAFYSERYATCRALSAVLERLAPEYSDCCKFCKVDVDAQEGLTQQFDILHIPTLVYLQDGEIVQRISGLRSGEEILEILNLN
ncbi:MAG: thioredoxin family protein [Faecousia sp.]